jgi:hypothetical protein
MVESKENEITRKLDPKNRTFFIHEETLLYDENELIEYKNYQTFPVLEDHLVETLKKAICGFLNQKGGRLYIGINDDKVIKGIYLTDKNQDISKNFIQNLTAHFYPKCRTEKIRIDLIPIRNDSGEYITNLFVVKVIIKQGDTDKLYSMTDRQYYSTLRLNGLVQTLYCEEIMKEIFRRTSSPKEGIPDSEFDDPEPMKPIYTNKELILTQDNYYLKEKVDIGNSNRSSIGNSSTMHKAENPFVPNKSVRKLKDVVNKENTALTKLRVTGLDASTTLSELNDLFKNFELHHSNPIDIQHATLEKEIVCIAYVDFDNVEEAIKAKSELEFVSFKNKRIYIKIL